MAARVIALSLGQTHIHTHTHTDTKYARTIQEEHASDTQTAGVGVAACSVKFLQCLIFVYDHLFFWVWSVSSFKLVI